MRMAKLLRQLPEKLAAIREIILARTTGKIASEHKWGNTDCANRVLFVANALIPTLQLSFIKPLSPLFDASELTAELLTEQQILARFGSHRRQRRILRWIDRRLTTARPTIIVFCRYSGRYVTPVMEYARANDIRTIFHIDDDLLNVPQEIGRQKYEYHNHPLRLQSVRNLLRCADLVYCSTEALKRQLSAHGDASRFVSGQIYCSGTIITHPRERNSIKIGYMGFDHNHDFELVVPALVQLMREFPHLCFELFGSIDKPTALDEFGDRIQIVPPVRDYTQFLQELAARQWDIGICPLAKTPFNLLKANTKWVEYTAVGAAVVASRGTVYDQCCADGCGLLAEGIEEWGIALRNSVTNSSLRYEVIRCAQRRLENEYSVDNLTQQVLRMFALANELPQNKLNEQLT